MAARWRVVCQVGKTLGFVGVDISDSGGRRLISGRHIKYMPMGALFDVGFHPWVCRH